MVEDSARIGEDVVENPRDKELEGKVILYGPDNAEYRKDLIDILTGRNIKIIPVSDETELRENIANNDDICALLVDAFDKELYLPGAEIARSLDQVMFIFAISDSKKGSAKKRNGIHYIPDIRAHFQS